MQEHRILKKLPCDGKNSDFICASQHNCYLILHTRLPYIVAYAYNRDFWNLQPDEIGQNENFTKFVQIDKAVIQYIRSILQRVFFAPVIIPWNATHSKITTKCYDCITYWGGSGGLSTFLNIFWNAYRTSIIFFWCKEQGWRHHFIYWTWSYRP